MANLDFPNSPSENDIFAAGSKTYKYLSGKWELVKFQPADSGNLDGGDVSNPIIKVNGGSYLSSFPAGYDIDGGTQ
jgi:hypothetical protein